MTIDAFAGNNKYFRQNPKKSRNKKVRLPQFSGFAPQFPRVALA
jgi:hypothetical protein